jgi:hypothetical protein
MKSLSIDLHVISSDNIVDRNDMAEITFEAECEDMQPDFEEEFLDEFAKTLQDDVIYQYDGVSHNWFCAKVTVLYRGFEEVDYLGGCSYASYDEFVSLEGDYFTGMVETCVERINESIQAKNESIRSAWALRKEFISKGQYEFFLDNLQALRSY